MSEDTDTVKQEYINKKKELICNYYKAFEKNSGMDVSGAIIEFKTELINKSNYLQATTNALNDAISNTKFIDDLEKKNRKFKKEAGKVLSGTQLKQDVYEENTNLTIHLLYYILGMGFMGYYIIKLLKK
jgi:hypothetical protein